MTDLNKNKSEMITAVFLKKILPDEGLIVLAEFNGGGMKRHHFCPNFDEASKKIHELNNSGAEVYHACATYKTDANRKQDNVARVKSFWVDIDVGKADGYQTRNEAKDAISHFCKTVGFQPPIIVSSGKGLHCYWTFDAAVTGDVWKAAALNFRKVLDSLNFKHDPSRTTDQSSILRPVGSTWRKAGERQVTLAVDSRSQPFGWYVTQLDKYLGTTTVPLAAPSKKYIELFPIEKLGDSESSKSENYHYEENKEDYYTALCAAYPNPTSREEWRAGICSLAYLVVKMNWPEYEVRKIRISWENLAVDVDKSDNESQWEDALARTKGKVENNDPTITHLTTIKKARDNGWKPLAKITDALTSLQDKFALISLGGKVGIVDKHKLNSTHADGTASRLVVMSRNDGGLLLLRFLAKEFPQVDAKNMLSAFSIDKNTTLFDGVEFNPLTTTPNVLNLWVGQTINPVEGEWPLIHSLLREVLCGGRESEYQYLIKYIAHALQKAWEKPRVMIILLGGQGVGKGTLSRVLRKIWSATFLQVNRIDQIVGDFNGSLERAYTVFLDEALFVGDRKHSDALKSLVTEQTISVNEKHQPARQITSYHRFFSATNAEHFKATDRDDRRDFVLRVSEHRKGDHDFWNALNAEIDGGGVEACAHYLLNIDLSDFNVRAKPNTRELTEQKLQSLEKFPRWWFDCLSQGTITNFNNEWPEFISSATLLSLFKEADKSSRVYKQIIDRDLVTFMGKICPSAKRDQGKEGLRRCRGYMLPTIGEAREDFEKYIGDIVDWDTA